MSWRPQHGPPLTGAGDPPGQQPRPAPEHGAPTWQPAHVGYAAPGSQWAPPPAPPPAPWAGSANPWSPPGAAPQAPPFYAPHGPQPHTSHAGHYVPPGAPHRGAAWADPPQPPWPAQGFLGRVPAGRSDTSPSFASYSATNERYRYGSEPGLGYGSAPAVAGFGPPPASLKGPQPEVSDRGPSPMPWKDWYRNYAPYGMPPGPPNNDPNARIDPQPDRTPSGPRLQSRESLASAGALLDLRTQATYAAGESYASARPANPEHAQRAPSPAAPSPPSPASSVSYREDNLNSQQDSERLSSTRTSKGNRQRLDIKTKEPDGEFYTYRPPAQNSARSRKRRDSGDFDYRPVRKSRKEDEKIRRDLFNSELQALVACIPGLDVVPAAATRLSAVIHAQEYIRQLQEREKKLRIMLAGTRRGNGTREEAMAAIEKELEETEPPPSQVSPVTAAEATEARTVADEPGTTNEKTHNTMQDEPRSDNLSGEMPSVAAVSGGPEEERGPATGTFEPRDSEDVRRITN